MQSPFTAKEQLNADTPQFFFDCTMSDGSVRHWSSRSFNWNGVTYEPRVMRHNLFEAQLASENHVGGVPKLSFELANADSALSQLEHEIGFKGAKLTVQVVFVDLIAGAATSNPVTVFRGLMNPPDMVTETSFRLSAMNRISMQRTVLPNVRVERMCPWRFPTTEAQRVEAVDGGTAKGVYSPFYKCGYSPDQPNGVGNLNGSAPFTTCSYSRSNCEERGMFNSDSSGRPTARFGGIEYVPPTILVRGSGQKNYSLSAVQNNTAAYNDFVPLIYGTQWHVPDVVFLRNDGNLTRMEVLLGMGEIEGVLKVLVNDIEIPQGVSGVNMTAGGWYNIITRGTRNGKQDPNFTNANGIALGDPFGSMAYLSVVVPNRISDGSSIPSIQVLMQGLKLQQFDADGNYLGSQFSNNPAWVLFDTLMRCGYSYDDIDTGSFARAAAYADQLITTDDPVGGHVQIPRFQCNFALKESRSAGDLIRSIRNGSRLYVVLGASGALEARVEDTFALQQPNRPANSNAIEQFNGGWAAYEFDATSIARNNDGSASVRLTSKGAQDTPNRLSLEFQDSFNQYQQDSLSLVDEDDVDLCGQEISAGWDAVGVSTFSQASRMVLLALNRGIEGNHFIEFQTSVKALGLMPGDLITVTYAKENLNRTPFRVLKISSGPGFRTAVITAQFHNDLWYSDAATGIIGGTGWQTGQDSGLPDPVGGTILDAYGNLQLGIVETEVAGSDGSADVQLSVAFTSPGGQMGTLAAPLVGLNAVVSETGGTLNGGSTFFYGFSAIDSGSAEGPLSFIVQAVTATDTNTNSVVVDGLAFPAGTESFNVYRGIASGQLSRIATAQAPQASFTDTGLPALAALPPDPRFDHVNLYWRWELLPETAATSHSLLSVGNPVLELQVNRYANSIVRISRGKGAGQERVIASNTSSTLALSAAWSVEPDSSSYFTICENSWRIGGTGNTSPIPIDLPERMGAGVEISARAANVADQEAEYAISPLTRWVIGESGGLAADSDMPPAPTFGLSVSPTVPGGIDLSAVGFSNLVNTTSIVGGTYRFHLYDEINGPPAIALDTAVSATDTTIRFVSPVDAGSLVQIDAEIIWAGATDSGGNTSVQRAQQRSVATSHPLTALVYPLREKIAIVPFVRNFFGSPASGDWRYSLQLPGVRIASAELFLTNSLGDGAVSTVCLTDTNEKGLRTLGGGQFSFQIAGYLAIQTGAAPDVLVDASRVVGQIYGVLRTPSSGAGVTLQLNLNGNIYTTVQFDPGATVSGLVDGFGLPNLRAGDRLSLDVAGVGTTNPGSDLTLVMSL